LYLENITTLRQAIFPIGWNILNHAFLRFYTDYGLGIFAFLVYLAIGCGIYGLARQMTSRRISIVSTLAVITMPQIVLQSTSMNTDLPLAGVAVFCFLLLFRLYQNINIIDLILIALASAFGLSIKLTFLLFLAPFTLFSGYLLLTKYSIKKVIESLMVNYKWVLLTIFPVFILSQVWLYIHNHNYYGGWSGPPDYIDHFQQKDGLKGMGSNLVRYLFESIDLMPPTNLLSDALFDLKISDQIDKIYDRLAKPLIGNTGFLKNYLNLSSRYQFKIVWRYVEGNAWYGWLGFLLAIPSIIYNTIKGKNFTRIVSLILICFFLLVCYKVAWSPWRGRFFALLFASSGICIANALNDLHLSFKKTSVITCKIIITISLITMIITMLANEDKAMFDLRKVDANNIFSRKTVDFIADQNIWTQTNFGQKRMRKTIRKELEPQVSLNSQIALLGNYYVNLYDYLMALPEVDLIPIHTSSYPNIEYRFEGLHNEFTAYPFPNPLKTNLDSFDYLLCLDVKCKEASNEVLSIPNQLIWHFIPSEAQVRKLIIPDAQLFKLH
jgi:hypothetical protein